MPLLDDVHMFVVAHVTVYLSFIYPIIVCSYRNSTVKSCKDPALRFGLHTPRHTQAMVHQAELARALSNRVIILEAFNQFFCAWSNAVLPL